MEIISLEPLSDASGEFINALSTLKEFHGKELGQSKFAENQISGNLFKKGNPSKFFKFVDSDSMYFRFFTLYFLTNKLYIDQNKKTSEGRKVIEFRSILDC
jgi:hypothetical protein